MAGVAYSTVSARMVRVRVCTSDPLPSARFWILVDPNESLQSFQNRVKDVLHRQHGDLPVAQANHLVCHLDDFEIVGDFGKLVHDNDLITVGVRNPNEYSSAVAKECEARNQSSERDLMAEASRISLRMRPECDWNKPVTTLGTKRKASTFLPLGSSIPTPSVSAALDAFEVFKKSRTEATSNAQNLYKGSASNEEDEIPETDHEDEDDNSMAEIDPDDEEDIDEVDEDDGLTLENEVDDSPVVENVLDKKPTSTVKMQGLSNEEEKDDDESEEGSSGDSSNDTKADSSEDGSTSSSLSSSVENSISSSSSSSSSPADSSGPEEEPSIPSFIIDDSSPWVPPGQGKARTRRKNQKRREKLRTQQKAQTQDSLISSEYAASTAQLPPGGGALDITPASAASIPSTNPSLESIAKRMLTRTTVGHRRRRSRQPAPAVGTGFVKASELPVSANKESEKIRVPPPSQVPPDEVPEGLTISSTDCEAWYNDQWNENYDGDYDEVTQAYLSMQYQIQKQVAEEKRREEDFTTTDQEVSVDGTSSSLRDALPMSFGRPTMRARPTQEEVAEVDATGDIDQVKTSASKNSILERFKAIRSSIYGS